jgi:hypothetical protein
MTSTSRYALIAGIIVVLAIAAYVLNSNYGSQADSARTGTERLTAEQVVDAEVEAAAQFEAAGGEY